MINNADNRCSNLIPTHLIKVIDDYPVEHTYEDYTYKLAMFNPKDYHNSIVKLRIDTNEGITIGVLIDDVDAMAGTHITFTNETGYSNFALFYRDGEGDILPVVARGMGLVYVPGMGMVPNSLNQLMPVQTHEVNNYGSREQVQNISVRQVLKVRSTESGGYHWATTSNTATTHLNSKPEVALVPPTLVKYFNQSDAYIELILGDDVLNHRVLARTVKHNYGTHEIYIEVDPTLVEVGDEIIITYQSDGDCEISFGEGHMHMNDLEVGLPFSEIGNSSTVISFYLPQRNVRLIATKIIEGYVLWATIIYG